MSFDALQGDIKAFEAGAPGFNITYRVWQGSHTIRVRPWSPLPRPLYIDVWSSNNVVPAEPCWMRCSSFVLARVPAELLIDGSMPCLLGLICEGPQHSMRELSLTATLRRLRRHSPTL